MVGIEQVHLTKVLGIVAGNCRKERIEMVVRLGNHRHPEGHRVKVYFTQDLLLPAYENHRIAQSF